MAPTQSPWQLLVYRLPTQPSSARVGVWRDLRRLGALPLQQSCVAVPEVGDLDARLSDIAERILALGGDHYRFRLTDLSGSDDARLRSAWNELRGQEYAEIAEECRTKFAKEVEFEIFRDNLTAAEAEELEADLDKIRAWFERIRARDWFAGSGRPEAEAGIAASQRLLDDFLERVYEREVDEGPSLDPPLDVPWGSQPEGVSQGPVVRLRRKRTRSTIGPEERGATG
jgi:hypothetical protein